MPFLALTVQNRTKWLEWGTVFLKQQFWDNVCIYIFGQMVICLLQGDHNILFQMPEIFVI